MASCVLSAIRISTQISKSLDLIIKARFQTWVDRLKYFSNIHLTSRKKPVLLSFVSEKIAGFQSDSTGIPCHQHDSFSPKIKTEYYYLREPKFLDVTKE